jgi:hypothetical protein
MRKHRDFLDRIEALAMAVLFISVAAILAGVLYVIQ